MDDSKHRARPPATTAPASPDEPIVAAWDRLWARIRGGRHAAALGVSQSSLPSPPPDLRALRIRCDAPTSTFGPLLEARRRIEGILGDREAVGRVALARERVLRGLRHHLFGDLPQTGADAIFVEAANCLALVGARPAVLIFEAVEAADEATLASLRELLLRPQWLHLPLLLVFGTDAPKGLAGAVLAAIQETEGATAVLQAPASAEPQGAPAATEFRRAPPADALTGLPANALTGLPADALTILRAGAVVGSGFEVTLVAALLDRSPLEIFLGIQAARDAGVAIDDPGDGRLYLSAELRESLLGGLLPSLATFWHRQLAFLVDGDRAEETSEETSEAGDPSEAGEGAMDEPAPSPETATAVGAAEGRETAVGPGEAVPEPPSSATMVGVLGPRAPAMDPEAAAPAAEEPARDMSNRTGFFGNSQKDTSKETELGVGAPSAPGRSRRRRRPGARTLSATPAGDPARAADHLSASGDPEAAAHRYLAAAEEAATHFADGQALGHARRALALLDGLPVTASRRQLQIRALLEIARVQWGSAEAPRGSTLEAAKATATTAHQALSPDDPPELHAQVALTVAGIGYDLGDLRSLEGALEALSAASRRLLAAGDPLGAGSLLNDQAAIYIRLGDPVRALHLLGESRAIFEARGDDEPLALIERAETHHLYARVPLHARIQPGRERDALMMGRDHALIAEELYRRLDEPRELARVWETLGRIELARGRRDDAAKRLVAALEVQREFGDAIGLARTSAALADLRAAEGDRDGALRLLAASIALNRDRGSPVGLAFNRQALERLTPAAGTRAGELFGAVRAALEAAEATLGRRPLPPGLGLGEGAPPT